MPGPEMIDGRYELIRLISSGGMGTVWEGIDRRTDRAVAVKVVRSGLRGGRRDEVTRRLRREARIMARLPHRGVPVLYDFGTHDDELFLVMELVPGITVADLIAENDPLPVAWAVEIAAQIAGVLVTAHMQSLVHRDLKPANLMLTPDGTVKVLDFGVAAAVGVSEFSTITRSGEGVGTIGYMAPEQLLLNRPGPRSDLYALGSVLFEMLTGSRAFAAQDAGAAIERQLSGPAPSVRSLRPDVPVGLGLLVGELLAVSPIDRPPDAGTVCDRLAALARPLPPLPGVVVATLVAPSGEGSNTFTSGLDARRQGEELVRCGRFTEAIRLLGEAATGAAAAHGSGHRETLALRRDLAAALHEAGEHVRAAEMYASLIEELTRALGPGHASVLASRFQQALCLGACGRFDEALSGLAELLSERRRVFGAGDRLTLEIGRERAVLLALSGDAEAGSAALTELIEDAEQHPGAGPGDLYELRTAMERLT